jgi:hypothetical protein
MEPYDFTMASEHHFRLSEAKWFLQFIANTDNLILRQEAINDYEEARDDFADAEFGDRADLVRAILDADDDTLCQFRLFLGGEGYA